MTRTFSECDHILRICKKTEIGQPWQDRWSINDFLANDCAEHQVGKSKTEQSPEQPEPEEDIPDLPGIVFDREMAAYRRDPDAYKARTAPGVLVKLLAMDEDRRQEHRQVERKRVAITPDTLASFSTSELKMFLFEKMLQFVPEHDRPAVLALLDENPPKA